MFGVGLAVDQDQVGPDVTVPVVLPLPAKRMVAMARRERPVIREPGHDMRELLATVKKCAYSLKSAGCHLPDVEPDTWDHDASSRCAAPPLRSGPSGDPPQPQVQQALHGRKGTSGHEGQILDLDKFQLVKCHI